MSGSADPETGEGYCTRTPDPCTTVEERDCGTSSVCDRRLSVEWSGTATVRPRRLIIEPIKPSVWRSASRNTVLNVSAVRIASDEYQA